MIDFDNTQIAFKAKSNSDLRRARFLFKFISKPWVVSCGKFFSKIASKLHLPIGWLLKPTIYKQFVGGETLEDCVKVTDNLMKYNIQAVLDNSVEGGGSDKDLKKNFDEAVRAIKVGQGKESTAFAVFKPSGLANVELLEKASGNEELSAEDKIKLDVFKERIDKLCLYATETKIPVLVDAEHVAYQPIIDEIVLNMMRKYNKQSAFVYNTLQMYRHDRFAYLEQLYADAVEFDYIVGIKFVRGAYMEYERDLAKAQGYPDPICATKELTDENFDNGLRYAIEHIDRFAIFAGTHNEASTKLLVELMEEKGIDKTDKRVYFSQLYGMSDFLSFNLAYAGYRVAKYLPYAPVKSVLPYLTRRAEENTSIAGQTPRELDSIAKELQRRKGE